MHARYSEDSVLQLERELVQARLKEAESQCALKEMQDKILDMERVSALILHISCLHYSTLNCFHRRNTTTQSNLRAGVECHSWFCGRMVGWDVGFRLVIEAVVQNAPMMLAIIFFGLMLWTLGNKQTLGWL